MIDIAADFALNLEHRARTSDAEKKSIARALAARRAIVEIAGIRLPGPRPDPPDPEEETPTMNRESWTVSQIAATLSVARSTVIHRIRRVGGAILATYMAATHEGRAAVFTPEQSLEIMNACGGAA